MRIAPQNHSQSSLVVYRVLVFLLILSSFSGCGKPNKLYFVPIGDAPSSEIRSLVEHYREKFGVEVQVLPPMTPDASDVDSNRGQLIAENLIQSMQRLYPDYVNNKSAVLIGITSQDMYPKGEDWQFCFGWRLTDDRVAVVSSARMDIHYPGEPRNEAILSNRLRKVVTKDIGILYYEKKPSENPRSVLYSNILGIQELDQVTEDF
jgi:predicted Zn-dependent protease